MSDEYNVNFDAAGGIALHPVAAAALAAAAEDGWADPARPTRTGRQSAVLLEAARSTFAEHLGVRMDEVIFRPSAAEALQAAIFGALAGRARTGDLLVHSAVEHSTAIRAAQWHAARGGRAVSVRVDANAMVDAADFLAQCDQPGAAVGVLQAANHEVGTRQPVAEVAQALAGRDIELVVDATHDFLYGTLPAAPLVTLDARLWGGPGGVGVLIVRGGSRWRPPWPADETESGRGLGVPNVAAIVAAAAALRAHRTEAQQVSGRLFDLIELMRHRIPQIIPDVDVLGHPSRRMPHVLTFSALLANGQQLLTEFDRHGFAVSSGSSCSADTVTPSHVLLAMNALTGGNIRVSLTPQATRESVERFLDTAPDVIAGARSDTAPDVIAGARSDTAPDVIAGARSDTAPDVPTHAPQAADPLRAQIVDSRERRCPLPVLDLARALSRVQLQEAVSVLADDPAAAGDIAAWCRMRGQQLVSTAPADGGGQAFLVRRLR